MAAAYREPVLSLDLADPGADIDLGALNKTVEVAEDLVDAPSTPEVTEKLAALRAAVADVPVAPEDQYWTTDHALHRFLVARQLKVDKAAEMYRNAMAWRIANGVGRLVEDGYKEPVAMRRYFPWGIIGTDKTGFPILVERIGMIDLVGMSATLGPEDFLRWVSYYHELQERILRGATAKAGRNRSMMTCIIDMKGMSMSHLSSATLQVLRARLRLEQDYYPEVVRRVFMINTPSLFATVWGVVRHFLDAGTAEKIHIMGSTYLPTLTKYIPLSHIPAYLGGTLVDTRGSEECGGLIGPGGLLPSAYLLGVAVDGLGMGEHVGISAGKFGDVCVRAGGGTMIQWKWGMEEKDVVFSVSAIAASEDAGDGVAVLDVTSSTTSVCGVQLLKRDYDPATAIRIHGGVKPTPQASGGDIGAPIPGARVGGRETLVVPAVRGDKHTGSYTVPEGETQIVRLRWDNSSSWMTGKAIVRRIDALLPGDSYESPVGERLRIEVDPLEGLAVDRLAAWDALGV